MSENTINNKFSNTLFGNNFSTEETSQIIELKKSKKKPLKAINMDEPQKTYL